MCVVLHKGRFVVTVGVLSSKGATGLGPRVARSEPEQGVLRRSTTKAVHTQTEHTLGGSCQGRCSQKYECRYLRGVRGLAPASGQSKAKQGVVWESTGKAVRTKGGAHKR